jgi:hypothetical protein
MPKATQLLECRRLCDAVSALGGVVPAQIQHLLAAHDLLSRPGAAESPERAILTHALDGTLDTRTLEKLLPAAATAQLVDGYRRDLAGRAEHVLLGQVHRELDAGAAADQILDGLRNSFNEHAQAISHARTLINPESTAENILQTGQPELVSAWQTLTGHLTVITRIAAVASQFGCLPTASFPQINEYVGAGSSIDDRALMCTAGDLAADSWLFGRPDSGHRSSPWFRTSLKMHTIVEAKERHDRWAADRWDDQHSGPQESWIDEHGQMHQKPKPRNPYREKAAAQ